MLTKAERNYLNGNLKPKPAYKRKLHERIRRKAFRALEDITLVFEKMTPRDLHVTRTKYNLACGLWAVIQRNMGEAFWLENLRTQEVAAALTRARIRYDPARLTADGEYRDRLLMRCPKKFWKAFGLDFYEQVAEEWKQREAKGSHA